MHIHLILYYINVFFLSMLCFTQFTVFCKLVKLTTLDHKRQYVDVGLLQTKCFQFCMNNSINLNFCNVIICFKALWRGHCSRKYHDTSNVISMRRRLREVNRRVKEEDKLCNKTTTALSYLLGLQNYAYILAALKHLGTMRFSKLGGWLFHKITNVIFFFYG